MSSIDEGYLLLFSPITRINGRRGFFVIISKDNLGSQAKILAS